MVLQKFTQIFNIKNYQVQKENRGYKIAVFGELK